MSIYFHGWRRKMAVVTLAMAVALMVMWIRSATYADFFVPFLDDRRVVFVGSFKDRIKWVCSSNTPNTRQTPSSRFRHSVIHDEKYPDVDLMPIYGGSPIEWRWKRYWGGFLLGDCTTFGFDIFTVQVPYWSLTTSLTLLSAVLLLGKSNRTKQQTSREVSTESHANVNPADSL